MSGVVNAKISTLIGCRSDPVLLADEFSENVFEDAVIKIIEKRKYLSIYLSRLLRAYY